MSRLRVFLLAGFSFLVVSGGIAHGEKVTLKFKDEKGQSNVYKNSWTFEYFSRKAELIDEDKSSGTVDVRIYGSWKSKEEIQSVEGGTTGFLATLRDAESTVTEDRAIINEDNFPFLLDMFNNRKFSWKVTAAGEVEAFKPEFKIYEVRREGAISDLHQLWMPELRPVLPQQAVGQGDSWTGEQAFEIPITELQGKGMVEIKSTYILKKLKEKKGVKTAEIEEMRQMRYEGWLFSNAVSIVVKGEGKGKGKWLFDVDRGLVLEQEIKVEFKDVDVTVVKDQSKVEDADAKMKLEFKRELDEK